MEPAALLALGSFAVYFGLVAALAVWLAAAPKGTVFHLFGRTLGPADVAHRLVRRGLILGLLLPSLLAIELVLEGWKDSSLREFLIRPSASTWSDIGLNLFWLLPGHAVVVTAFSLGISLLSAAWLHQQFVGATGLAIEIGGWPVPVQTLAFFAVYSFFDYWQHRLDHSTWFWPLHRYHHAAEEFCVLTSVRVHPAAFSAVIGGLVPGMLIGVSDEALFWVFVSSSAVRFLIHSRIRSDFGWFGRWVIQSPLHHRLHHKLELDEPASNYGLTPIWDRLFGTWAASAEPAIPIGVSTPYRHGVWILPDLLRDYRHFWLALAGRYRDEAPAAPLRMAPLTPLKEAP